ncbi:threonylcarbamoyl-AMP synthase [Phototrophicus methaneseepsis]|uniref:Threonylcarbamoyl-AMP synthase n=1 Tax=Phototrophicus methaneseepsis TaxID=2710758 RepID=A0A7S8ED23_9CHLR|nr:L-threonylcarbamoyladenylate synthase [Phototrophicus methaneseepsis]QPC84737.1 threonylcarbamoyl-AMP synthase [Phototrophicus methaneseepsis]
MPYTAETLIAHVERDDPSPETIALASDILRAGGLVAFPTETVYGLGANALDADAISHIFEAKQRPANDPIIVHLAEPDDIGIVASDVPDLVGQLAEAFWPGPLTLIMKKHRDVPGNVTAQRDTVAVRIPNHPIALSLLRASGVPIGAPSANRFSRPSPTRAEHVLADLGGHVDVVLDGGNTDIGVESTILDLTSAIPTLLRPGGIPLEALRDIIPDVQYTPLYIEEDGIAPSPGTLSKHYAPQAQLTVYDGPREIVLPHIHRIAEGHLENNDRVGLLLPNGDVSRFEDLPVSIATLGDDESTTAARLYAALRELDNLNVDIILARAPEEGGLGLAIRDRMTRAAEGRVVKVQS